MLGRLEYQKGNFDAALQVFQGIDIRTLTPRMTKAIVERTRQRKGRSKSENLRAPAMSMHSVSLLLEAILLKARSLEELGRIKGMVSVSCGFTWLAANWRFLLQSMIPKVSPRVQCSS